jgi:hypothetical protein
MKIFLIILFLFPFFTKYSFCALPPKYQFQRDFANITDLAQDLVEFKSLIKENGIYKLKYISSNKNLCFINFKRGVKKRPRKWAGPAENLVVDNKICREKYD